MIIKEGAPHPNQQEHAFQREILPQQPCPEVALASQPLALADATSALGTKRAASPSILSSQTIGAQANVAIPRQRTGIAQVYNRRVPRACESCRVRKTKCSGDTPVCRQCHKLWAKCNYPQGWREKTRKSVHLYLNVWTEKLGTTGIGFEW